VHSSGGAVHPQGPAQQGVSSNSSSRAQTQLCGALGSSSGSNSGRGRGSLLYVRLHFLQQQQQRERLCCAV
jgi:hypothetical protein